MNKLLVLNASAGSGKTFRLVGEYLALAITNVDLARHILAVTFTNKATAEMKMRILYVLDSIINDNENGYTEFLIRKTGLTKTAISQNAKILLKELLHNYSQFSVFTIDTFFQRVLHSFKFELSIKSGIKTELNEKPAIHYVVNRILCQAPFENKLANWLFDFAWHKIDKGKSWDIEKEILKLGPEFLGETFYFISKGENNLVMNFEFIKEFETHLDNVRKKYLNELRKKAKECFQLISDSGYSIDDFLQKDRGIAGFIKKVAESDTFVEFNSYVRKADKSVDDWISKTHKNKNELQQFVTNQLYPKWKEISDYYSTYETSWCSIDEVLKNIYLLALAGYFLRFLKKYSQENQVMLLSQTPKLIESLLSNDIWFVFEKTGTQYRYLMIDEFQDTSRLQWINFKPLFDQCLSDRSEPENKNLSLIVGDVKQAIYRWRNGDWEILASEIADQYRNYITTEALLANYRSHKNIVHFNNNFFSKAPDLIESFIQSEYDYNTSKITLAYKDVWQEVKINNAESDGCVLINCFPEAAGEFSQASMKQTISVLNQLLDLGYKQSDIAILTRKAKEAKLIASYLLHNQDSRSKFRIVSNEALLYQSCPAIRIMTAALEHFLFPERITPVYTMISDYYQYFKNVDINTAFKNQNCETDLTRLLPARFLQLVKNKSNIPVIDFFTEVYQCFGFEIKNEYQAYISGFIDQVQQMAQQGISDYYSVLKWWQDSGDSLSLQVPEGIDAIHVLTIHKAKGLEFKAVILPFCNWKMGAELNNTIFWANNVDVEKLDIPDNHIAEVLAYLREFPKFPLTISKSLSKSWFREEYYNELTKSYIDSLNLLYVATTRAINFVCINIPDNNTSKSFSQINQLITKVIDNNAEIFPGWQADIQNGYRYLKWGDLIQNSKNEEKTNEGFAIPALTFSNTYKNKIYILPFNQSLSLTHEKQAGYKGIVMHRILEGISHINDVEKSVKRAFYDGLIDLPEVDGLINYFKEILSAPEVISWFDGSWNVQAETSLLTPKGEIYRPDRIMIQNMECIVVDYKFSEAESARHYSQVRQYMQLLSAMGYAKVKGYLWYFTLGNKLTEVA